MVPKTRRKPHRAMLAAGALLAISLLGPAEAVAVTAKESVEFSKSELERQTGLRLPLSSIVLGAAKEQGIDSLIEFKLSIDASEFDLFLQQNNLAGANFSPAMRGILGADHGSWDPSKPAVLSVAAFVRPKSRTLEVGVTPAQDGQRTIYIRFYSV